jgi:hypothetical protein
MAAISFTYYPPNSRPSPKGDGDIKKKAEALSKHPDTPYTTLATGMICRIALHEWLDTVDPLATLPRMQAPIATRKEHVSFSNGGDDLETRLEKLRAPEQSKYKHLNNARIYVIGINAWLDAKIAFYGVVVP